MTEPKYIPSQEALKFIAFLRATGNEENTSPEAHYKIADILFSNKKKDWKVVIECLRGVGKSTLVEYVFIYVAAIGTWPNFGKVPFVVFLGASQEGNVKAFFKNVAGKIENSNLLRSLITVQRQTDNEIELVNKDGVETIAAGRGMSTNWRGIRSRTGKRPTVLIADDVLPNDVMTSEVIRKTIEVNWFNSALPALDPIKHKVIYIGTPLSESDLLHQLKRSGAYKIIRFPLCPKFPVPEDEFQSVWPDRFSYEYTRDLFNQYKAAGTTQSFYTEYMLEITDLTTLLVEDEDIQWYDPTILKENKHNYNFYISTDFATSTKKSADFSTIGVWAISSNNDWLLVDGQCLRQTMQENIDDLFRYVKKWSPLSVGIENSGQQGGFISIMQEMMMKRNIWFTFAKKQGSKDLGIRPIKDKMHRFVTGVQPKFKQNKIWFPKPEIVKTTSPRLFGLIEEMTHELSRFTLAGGVKTLAHDDCVTGDTLVTMADGSVKRIDAVKAGDEVMTFDIDLLTQLVEDVRMTGVKEVSTYVFSDGTSLCMTDNHPVLTTVGYIPAALLTSEDEVLSWNNKNTLDVNGQRKSQDTTKVPLYLKTVNDTGCTNTFGNSITVNKKKDFMSTIKTAIKTTIQSKIWNCYPHPRTQGIMDSKEIWINKESIWKRLGQWLMNGINPKKVENGPKKTLKTIEKKCLGTTIKNAAGVKNTSKLDSLTGLPIATVNANFKQYKQMLKDRKNLFANGVENLSNGIEKNQDVAKNAAIIYLCEQKDRTLLPTYNLEIAKTHNFLANGVVVHNCIDLLNQLSEMEIYSPSETGDFTSSEVSADGTIWEFDLEDDDNVPMLSTVF